MRLPATASTQSNTLLYSLSIYHGSTINTHTQPMYSLYNREDSDSYQDVIVSLMMATVTVIQCTTCTVAIAWAPIQCAICRCT